MAALNIPNKHLQGIAKFLSLPEDLTEGIFESLKQVEVTTHPERAIRDAVASATGLDPDDVGNISEALVALLIVYADGRRSLEELIEDIQSAFEDSGQPELVSERTDFESVSRRIIKFLSIENLFLSSKAVNVKFEQDNLFSYANVMTEILPVFSTNVDEQPKAAMLVHQLGLHYFQNGRHKTAYFRMDMEEIDSLISVLERAKRKAASLETFLGNTDVTYLKNI